MNLDNNSYSQLGQELWVLEFLNFKRNGVFVEIGAGNGIELSNTYKLEVDFDWFGLCVEPSRQFKFLKENRKALTLDEVIWHSDDVEIIFIEDYLNGEENWFSGIKTEFDCHKVEGMEFLRKTKSLNSLLKENNIPKHIQYLSIDTEGSEYEIIKNFPFKSWEIDLITIEHNFVDNKRQKIFQLLRKNGFIRQEIADSKFDDWYYHERLLKNPNFLIRRQEELYRKTINIKKTDDLEKIELESKYMFMLQDKEVEINSLQEEINRSEIEMQNLNLLIGAIQSSISWKITKPLRFIGRIFTR